MIGTAVDLKQQRKDLYQPPADEVTLVEVPEMRFLAIDGAGDPNTAPAFKEAIEALYTVAYMIKFLRKRIPGAADAPVMPLEGLWWTSDGSPFSPEHKDILHWTALIRLPDDVTDELFEEAGRRVAHKKQLPALSLMRLEMFREGRAAQIMYIGPYATEGPTISRLHASIAQQGGTLRGKHHEIYLGNPARTTPDKLKTILRQPFA
jgi:hypothetical protein